MTHHADHDHDAHGDHHHEVPTEGRALTNVAISATLHCLTGCAIGEIAGMAIGTALGFSNLGTIALAVGLAFLFGYTLTSLPLLRAGFALSAVVPIALASDTFSIAVMEVVDNAIMLVIPGAMEAGLSSVLFWGALSFALFIAFLAALPVNRWLIARGKGHVAVHNTGIHGGPDPRVVGAVLVVAAVFGAVVLVSELVGGGPQGHGMDGGAMSMTGGGHSPEHKGAAGPGDEAAVVRGLSSSDDGLEVEVDDEEIQPGQGEELSFRILSGGAPVTDFDVEHERRMHLIVVRKDLTGFQHLHPQMDEGGTWSTPLTLVEPGEYRLFADFNHAGQSLTLASDLTASGDPDYEALPEARASAATDSGYEVEIAGAAARAGVGSKLSFEITRDGEAVEAEPYLGANGHLVALRKDDLAFLHVHPVGGSHGGEAPEHSGHSGEAQPGEGVAFVTGFPSAGRYRLFLQFKHENDVHTAEFTRDVAE